MVYFSDILQSQLAFDVEIGG